jgi:hypothetical protein
MNPMKYIVLLTILVNSSLSVNAQEFASPAVISLERTACFGTCPVYTLTILEDGTVVYAGEEFVSVTGEQTGEIATETVALMVAAFDAAGYFGWEESYETQPVSDLPTIITSVTSNDQTHRIVRYAGDGTAPLALPFLEQWIDEMAISALWTGVQPDVSTISNGTDTPLITLRRGPNFGSAPTYSLAAYEDGTVVYTGVANVAEAGVQVFETEASTIVSIAQTAQILGYFGWADSYVERIITDQSIVQTSIRWEDQFKRIVRYEGDPNAPIGIVRIEESINHLLMSLMG